MVTQITPDQIRKYAGFPSSVTDDQLNPASEAAYLIVTEDLAASGLSDTRLDSINLNLAAHFASVSVERGGLTYQRIGQSEERYQTLASDVWGLMATRFGQIAVQLDTTGTLAGLTGKPLKARFEIVSIPYGDPC